MDGEEQEIKAVADEMARKMKSMTKEQVNETATKIAKSGALPRDALGLSDGMIEGIYGQAYRLYNTGKYKDAAQLFRLLVMINAAESKYTMGIAACLHMMKDYSHAVEAYTLCSLIDPQSPIPHFHASDCYIQMDDKVSALVSLEMAVKRAGEKKEFKTLKDRAQMTMNSIKEELAKASKT